MGTWERFARPPIVEAILDIRVTFGTPLGLAQLEAMHDLVRAEYPTKDNLFFLEGQLQLSEGSAEPTLRSTAAGLRGYVFRSPDRQRALQARRDGFTLNWGSPYLSWEALRDEARPRWNLYREALRPEAITRLGLRYLNRLEIPLPIQDFRDFILTAPDIAGGLPQGLSSLFMRIEIPDPQRGLVAIITETMLPLVDDGRRLPLIFDIDVVNESRFAPEDSAVWSAFEGMRDYKNEVFFQSITDRAREMFR
jgi:uncharacterized protein (TIGR04255 family)